MEGLIPYLIHALKREKPRNSYRSFSENSTNQRSYHRLLSESSRSFPDASSHLPTRSEFQLPPSPPSSLDFAERRSMSVSRRGFPSPSENRKGSYYSSFQLPNLDDCSSARRRKIGSK